MKSYKQRGDLPEQWDAIVVGSGIGGMATAAVLAKRANKRVLVLERHYAAGGFTHTFRRPGYEWDVGVHYIGEVLKPTSTMRRIFDYVSDGALQWADMGEVYDRIVIADRKYDFVKGRENFRARMHEYFPKEHDAIDAYLDRINATARNSQSFFAEKAMPRAIAAVFGGMMRRPLLKDTRRTTRSVLESLTNDQELIGVLTGQWGDYGLPPAESSFFIHAVVARHYLAGGAYPIGGSAQFADTIIPVIERAGGELLVRAEVQRILVEGGKAVGVEMEDGKQLRAPLVISDAGAVNTFRRLLPDDAPGVASVRGGLAELTPSGGHMSIYVGLTKTAEELGFERANLWVYPTPHHEENVRRFSDDPSAPFPVTYLSFPSAKDPDFQRRHPGRATVEVITLAPYAWFAKWEGTSWKKRGAEYDALKAGFQERLLDELYKQYPSARGHVEICELSTPLSTKNFAGHPQGEIYGLAHDPKRFEQRWLRPRTGVKGFYLTGADVCSAGVGGALMGGVLCASAVLGANVLAGIFRAPVPKIERGAGPLTHAPITDS